MTLKLIRNKLNLTSFTKLRLNLQIMSLKILICNVVHDNIIQQKSIYKIIAFIKERHFFTTKGCL